MQNFSPQPWAYQGECGFRFQGSEALPTDMTSLHRNLPMPPTCRGDWIIPPATTAYRARHRQTSETAGLVKLLRQHKDPNRSRAEVSRVSSLYRRALREAVHLTPSTLTPLPHPPQDLPHSLYKLRYTPGRHTLQSTVAHGGNGTPNLSTWMGSSLRERRPKVKCQSSGTGTFSRWRIV